MTTTWTFEGYWNVVLGANRSAADVVREFQLDASDVRGLDEWLGGAEADALATGGETTVPEEWTAHHARALSLLGNEAPRAVVICGVGETRIPLLRDASASEEDWEAFYRSTNSTGAQLANQARNEGGWCVTVRAADVDESDLDSDPAVRSYCTEKPARSS